MSDVAIEELRTAIHDRIGTHTRIHLARRTVEGTIVSVYTGTVVVYEPAFGMEYDHHICLHDIVSIELERASDGQPATDPATTENSPPASCDEKPTGS